MANLDLVNGPIPDNDYDFMFIDGPGFRRVFKDQGYPKCFNSDTINLLHQNKQIRVHGLIDQRIGTMRKIRRLVPGGNIKYKVLRKLTFFRDLSNDQLAPDLKIVTKEQ